MNIADKSISYLTEVLDNNQKVNYVRQGSGTPVILTHGLAASLHDWDDLLPELSNAGHTGYALDLLGHGESEKPVDVHDYSLDLTFEHFSKWIDSLGRTEPLILIGHSLGGCLSLMYAQRYPARVRGIVLVNPFYDIKQLPPVMQTVFRYQLINTALIDRTPYRLFRFLVDMTSFSFYIGSRESHVLPEHIRYQTAWDYKRAASGIYNIPRTMRSMDLDFSQITQPTLLLWGARDQTLLPSSFPMLKNLLSNLQGTHAMSNCGHVPHQCHPGEFNPHVMRFLASL